ncbi:hypothetical protein J5O04_08390 [Corynebacterium hindlerae]|nr:hypothetical protein [Corynebacterium hindlerae]QTH58852.1 hypothetical protein J5O04_08390 [Corynebacterium hindlerae]
MKRAQRYVRGVPRTVVSTAPDIVYVLTEAASYEPTSFHVCDVIEDLGG